MNIKNLESAKTLIGLEIRTKNSDEIKGIGKIPQLWEQFFGENISGKIKEKVSDDIYVVYSNYECDYTGEYDYFIGFVVKNNEDNMSGLKTKQIKTGKYSVITTEKGPAQKVVYSAWEKIWKMTDSDFGGARAYKTDFEVWHANQTPDNAIVDIYLGIK